MGTKQCILILEREQVSVRFVSKINYKRWNLRKKVKERLLVIEHKILGCIDEGYIYWRNLDIIMSIMSQM